jgi:hypothetical protein
LIRGLKLPAQPIRFGLEANELLFRAFIFTQLLDRMQADGLMAGAKTGKSPVTAETGYPSSLARLKRFLAGGVP